MEFHGGEAGLVGGHCISVDPYYLTHIAQKKATCLGLFLRDEELTMAWALRFSSINQG